MIATVRCYYNTGLAVSNCLDSYLSLDTLGFDYKDFSSVAIKQDRGLINIKLSTNYENIKDADYCRINNICYWVTSIHMLNDNVADVQLQQDYLTTLGISGLEVISGWCTRRHVVDDTLYSNVIDEPFTPSNKLEIDFGSKIDGGGPDGFYSIAVSTVDLLNITNTAKAYFDQDRDKILVPELPLVSSNRTEYKCDVVSPQKTGYIAVTNAYDIENENVRNGIKSVRQLGVESCIGASYMLPKVWATVSESGGLINTITNRHDSVTSTFGGTWGTYKNNKVYTGQFQKIINFSMCSGESSENRVEDIIDPTTKRVTWSTYADCRYSGKPGCKPKYYHNIENTATLESIHGANWQQSPFVYNISSGWGFTAENQALQRVRNSMGIMNNVSDGILGTTGPLMSWMGDTDFMGAGDYYGIDKGIRSVGSGALSTGRSIGSFMLNSQQLFANTNQQLMDTEVRFPVTPQMADYVGNAFYDMRYRLSDNDMTRFDNFLSSYGYAVDEVLSQSCFVGRTNHNYVKANDVTLKKSGAPLYLLAGAADQIQAGVRIWHVKPSRDKLIDNPIA